MEAQRWIGLSENHGFPMETMGWLGGAGTADVISDAVGTRADRRVLGNGHEMEPIFPLGSRENINKISDIRDLDKFRFNNDEIDFD